MGRFIGAPDPEHEVIFTKNATESVNLVAATWGRANLRPGDVVLLTDMEHHSNIVPWLMLAEERGIELRWIGVDEQYRLDLSDLDRLVEGVKLVACTSMSNVLGTITPFARIAEAAHDAGALVLADGAQSVPHIPTDVTTMGCDFLAFSAHKMLGPTGIGVLWARRDLLEAMPPFLGGGEHDPRRAPRRIQPQRAAHEVRGRHTPHRRGGGAGRGRVDTSRPWASRRSTPTRWPSPPTPRRPWPSASATICASSGRPAPSGAAGSCRSPIATSTPTTSPRSSTRPGCACGPAITAPSP